VRAWSDGRPVSLRNPASIRPWQHVLEPLSGYLLLGARLASGDAHTSYHGEAFNFGPGPEAFEPVESVVQAFREHWPGVRYELLPESQVAAQPHEARVLKLSNEKASELLRWRSTLRFSETLALTAEWYRAFYAGDGTIAQLTRAQIKTFAQQALLRNPRLAISPGS
jgi:CDP-glucose 4,6-dehydratase